MALVDHQYKFTFVDIGAYGHQSDGGVFSNCALKKAIEDGSLGVPGPAKLPGSDTMTSHFFVADAAFPLQE